MVCGADREEFGDRKLVEDQEVQLWGKRRQDGHLLLVKVLQYESLLRSRGRDMSFKVLVEFIPRGQALRARGRP